MLPEVTATDNGTRLTANGEKLTIQMGMPQYASVTASEPGVTYSMLSWHLDQHCWGVNRWWCLGDHVAAFHSNPEPRVVPKWIRNNWSKWAAFLSNLGPADLLLRKGIDRTGKDKAWQRVLVENAASTTGLLGIYTCQVNNCREPEPALVEEAMGHWLDKCLGDETWQLRVPLDERFGKAYTAAGSTAPASMCARLLGEGASLWILPFIDQSAGHVKIHLSRLFETMLQEGECSKSRVSLSKLLPALQMHPRLEWLYKALLFEVARQMDFYVHRQQWSSNPTEGDRCWGGRTDPALTSHLCQGLGSHEEVATNVNTHVNAFRRLRKPHRRWGKQAASHSVDTGQGLMMTRYLESCRSFLKNCHQYTIAYDASRIGGKEVLLLVLVATCCVSGHTRACWAPPQVAALGCF